MDLLENKCTSGRIYYLDILRVIACISVIMIHSSAEYVIKDIGSFNFWIGNILDGLSRIGVPLFVMISGTLLLDKNYKFDKKKLMEKFLKDIEKYLIVNISN